MKSLSKYKYPLLIALCIAALAATLFIGLRPRPIPFNREEWLNTDAEWVSPRRYGMALWLIDNYQFCGKSQTEILEKFVRDNIPAWRLEEIN